jgi:hypothetical protein
MPGWLFEAGSDATGVIFRRNTVARLSCRAKSHDVGASRTHYSGRNDRLISSRSRSVAKERSRFSLLIVYGGPRPWPSRQAMILRISSGLRMRAMTDILPPHFGQQKISISYTLAKSLAHARRRALTPTATVSPVSLLAAATAAPASRPYQLFAARNAKAGRFFHVPRPREE